MKKKKTHKIMLRKLTIARISNDTLNQIKGGSSVPPSTSSNFESDAWCEDSHIP
ncbi:class I lanthipeptide [Aquimarina algiphila]|uniref:class I lanthipeptide n=1 Tax=Aquimarina algiphila TaxID=2047982 RepID=UPI0014316C97|nr:class I lanthipeptide [Aquimarina algiphila]